MKVAKRGKNTLNKPGGGFSLFPVEDLTKEERLLALIEGRIDKNDEGTIDNGIRKEANFIRLVREGNWLPDFLTRNIKVFRLRLDRFEEKIKFCKEKKMLPQNFDLHGARIEFLVEEIKSELRAEARGIVKFNYAFKFSSKEEAKQKLEEIDFSNIDWQTLAQSVLHQITEQRKEVFKKAVDELIKEGAIEAGNPTLKMIDQSFFKKEIASEKSE